MKPHSYFPPWLSHSYTHPKACCKQPGPATKTDVDKVKGTNIPWQRRTSHILHVPAKAPKYRWGSLCTYSNPWTRSMYSQVSNRFRLRQAAVRSQYAAHFCRQNNGQLVSDQASCCRSMLSDVPKCACHLLIGREGRTGNLYRLSL
jgi:hypothetical protein